MQVKIIFDKDSLDKNLHTGWGISFLIDSKVLFDTGENGKWLIANMKKLKVDLNKLRAVVISHDHWDHTGGLWEILKKRKRLKVYACPRFSQEFKQKVKSLDGKLMETDKFIEVAKDIFVTGEIPGTYKGEYMPEQALIVKTKNGISVMTGCSHPGIIKILESVEKKFTKEKFYFVFGGFHLISQNKRIIKRVVERFKEMEIEKVGPTHCSGRETEEIFKQEYGNNYFQIKVGQAFEI